MKLQINKNRINSYIKSNYILLSKSVSKDSNVYIYVYHKEFLTFYGKKESRGGIEGETINIYYDSTDDMQKFIKSSYEVTEDEN